MTCDIAQPEGQALVRELARHCHVFVENFKVGDMARYGLDYAAIRAINPRIVYCSVTGFGQTGPYRERAGYDYAIQGMGGLMSITGERDDLGGGPQKVGVAVADLFTGMYSPRSASSRRCAMRERTGEGQHLDMALLDTQVAMLANLGGELPGERQGAGRAPAMRTRTSCPTRCSRRARRRARTTSSWPWATTASSPSSARWPDGPSSRAIRASPRTRTACATAACWCRCWKAVMKTPAQGRLAGGAGGGQGAVRRDQQPGGGVRRSAGARARHGAPVAASARRPLNLVASPLKLSGTPVRTDLPPPLLGQHTEEVLREVLGWEPDASRRLRKQEVI